MAAHRLSPSLNRLLFAVKVSYTFGGSAGSELDMSTTVYVLLVCLLCCCSRVSASIVSDSIRGQLTPGVLNATQ